MRKKIFFSQERIFTLSERPIHRHFRRRTQEEQKSYIHLSTNSLFSLYFSDLYHK
ncbi:hypothetical protein PORCRE_1416 [Porphyromonas crevioricanis JCM 15906]|uniref:Uncharacterized protein n=1 Tax=Porphyromonas crevioricanis JCM 15906 TaxID=1305617 RepID=T1DTB4_9PORP|nr:hypothetical protein PORCRE_1416 [Porphyromonas crevioricanis JCM 15906]